MREPLGSRGRRLRCIDFRPGGLRGTIPSGNRSGPSRQLGRLRVEIFNDFFWLKTFVGTRRLIYDPSWAISREKISDRETSHGPSLVGSVTARGHVPVGEEPWTCKIMHRSSSPTLASPEERRRDDTRRLPRCESCLGFTELYGAPDLVQIGYCPVATKGSL